MGCSSSNLEQHEWQPQREDPPCDDHAHEVHATEGLALNVGLFIALPSGALVQLVNSVAVRPRGCTSRGTQPTLETIHLTLSAAC